MPRDSATTGGRLEFSRRLSVADVPARDQVVWKTVPTANPGAGFSMPAVEVPESWSQNATNVMAQRYLRKRGVPEYTDHVSGPEDDLIPRWLWRSNKATGSALGSETSADQIFHRMAGCWAYWGWREGLFASENDAHIFYDEAYLSLARQEASPNSPQWFNTGLHWAYGIEGSASGQWAIGTDGKPYQTTNAYERPQPHACFIQPVIDDLVNEGGIMDLWTREVRLFKQGSGTGTNFSNIRGKGERLSNGGVSSGAMSFLRIGDVAAGSIASGGTTRRAAKMDIFDIDHPEVEDFIDWKVREELKAAALDVGSRAIQHYHATGEAPFEMRQAVIDRCSAGFEPEHFSADFEGEAYTTVSGQNANNTVRITNEFLRRVDAGELWELTARTTGETVKTVTAGGLWERICRAAWACADPGLQFDDTINEWHTCPTDGRINASNPCSEYLFLDNTACNLASLNLVAFKRPDGSLDLDAYDHACRLWTVILEISVEMASFPSREIAIGSHDYRTLGLGQMNVGGLLMRLGLPYDSDEGRSLIAALTALMTGVAYRTSAEVARAVGPFPRWEANADAMRRVLRNHARACSSCQTNQFAGYEGLSVSPIPYRRPYEELQLRIEEAWDAVQHAASFRNAQVTLCAPTGTISLVADCDTGGIEPDFSLIKYKNLAGGGSMTIINAAVEEALTRLGYNDDHARDILAYVAEDLSDDPKVKRPRGFLEGCPALLSEHLPVFDCTNPAPGSSRYLRPMAHVLMVAAAQPFLSGALSKTINLPNAATIADVDLVYREAHCLGLKAVALYRDGSKLSQPLSSRAEKSLKNRSLPGLPRGVREFPPWRREDGYTQKVKIGERAQSVFLTVNRYPDGRPCETFLELAGEGSTMRSLANLVAVAISVGLQYGVPVEEYVNRFLGVKFEPAGFVEGHDRIKATSSIADYVARELGITFLGSDELAQVTPSIVHEPAAIDLKKIGIVGGYTGDICAECGNATMRRSGTCLTCDCGANTGCG